MEFTNNTGPQCEGLTLERELSGFDTLIYQPKRLSILAALERGTEVDYSSLQRVTGITDGNLSAHLLRLEVAGFVETGKRFVDGKPHTTARITASGDAAIETFLARAERIVERWERRRGS